MTVRGIAVAIGWALVLGSSPGLLADETVPPKGADLDLLRSVRDAAARFEAVREARLPQAPVAVRAGVETRRALLDARLASWLAGDRVAARGRAWADLGLGAGDFPLRLAEALLADVDGIALEPDGRRLLVDPARLTPRDFGPTEAEGDANLSLLLATGIRPDEPLVAHVLAHALHASRSGAEVPTTTDAWLASAAWIEGEANVAALLLLFDGIGLRDEVLSGRMDPARVFGGRLLPAAATAAPAPLRSLLDFVYLEGFAQAAERVRTAGWRGLDDASSARPTTRDVLHGARPPAGVRPVDPPPPPSPGHRVVDVDVVGEQGIVTLVATLTGKLDLALQSGDGWDGDALARFETAEGAAAGVTVWRSRWTSDAEARDFEYGLERVLGARYPGTEPTRSDAGAGVWRTTEKTYRLHRQGREVLLRVASAAADRALEAPATPKTPPASRSK